MTKQYCNKCGKEMSKEDRHSNEGIHQKVGYGSKYDGEQIDIDLCCNCFDIIIDYISSQCKYSPFTEEECELQL